MADAQRRHIQLSSHHGRTSAFGEECTSSTREISHEHICNKVGAGPVPAATTAYPASMNSYLSVTEAPGRSMPRLFCGRSFHLQLAVTPLEFARLRMISWTPISQAT
jgi:hypothetical protein